MGEPRVILLFSGKRKSGKDYICEKLFTSFGPEKCRILRISEPLKTHYAKANNLDLNELMSDHPYKEKYRQDMIIWSDEIRRNEPGYFCKAACDNAEAKPVWIISDVRRKTDVKWFMSRYHDKVKTIRIVADDEIRFKRGWKFTCGVDDVASECDLDDVTEWDYIIYNNDTTLFNEDIQNLMKMANI